MWIPRFGEPFGDTPAECSGCRDKPPPALGRQCWIRIFSSEMPNPALQGDSGVWERGGVSGAALDPAALHLRSSAGEPWHRQSPRGARDTRHSGCCSPASGAPGPDPAVRFSAGLRTPSNSLHTGAS